MAVPSKVYKDRIEMLKGATKIQTTSYTETDYDPYMHGMANGMILAVAMMQDAEPEFLEAFSKKEKLDARVEAINGRPKKPVEYDH